MLGLYSGFQHPAQEQHLIPSGQIAQIEPYDGRPLGRIEVVPMGRLRCGQTRRHFRAPHVLQFRTDRLSHSESSNRHPSDTTFGALEVPSLRVLRPCPLLTLPASRTRCPQDSTKCPKFGRIEILPVGHLRCSQTSRFVAAANPRRLRAGRHLAAVNLRPLRTSGLAAAAHPFLPRDERHSHAAHTLQFQSPSSTKPAQ